MPRFCHRPGERRSVRSSPILDAWPPTRPRLLPGPADPRIARQFDARYEGWTPEEGFPELVDVSGAILDLVRDLAAAPERPGSRLRHRRAGRRAPRDGASRLTGVDLSPASIDLARQRAEDAGFAGISAFEVGNAADLTVEPHDWVVLDRVICCYGDVALVGRAIDLAGERIAISVPESRGWRGLVNRPLWLGGFAWDRWRAAAAAMSTICGASSAGWRPRGSCRRARIGSACGTSVSTG